MSRTYRKPIPWHTGNPLEIQVWEEDFINANDWDRVRISDYGYWHRPSYTAYLKPDSKAGKKVLALARKDKVIRFKEPGPAWFRNLYSERPQRRHTKKELQKFIADNDYEPMIESKRPLAYFT